MAEITLEELELEVGELQGLGLGAEVGAESWRAEPLEAVVMRDLTGADLQILADAPKGATVPSISRMRSRHHSVARLMAEGRSGVEIAAITGYTGAWISTMKQDPAFQELLAHYSATKEAVYVDVHARMASLGLAAAEELGERLEEKPSTFSNKELRELMSDAVDRSKPQSGAPAGAAVAISVKFVAPMPMGGLVIEHSAETPK